MSETVRGILSRSKNLITSFVAGPKDKPADKARLAFASTDEVIAGLHTSTRSDTSSQCDDKVNEDEEEATTPKPPVKITTNRPTTEDGKVNNIELVVDEISEGAAEQRKTEKAMVKRAAFKVLCRNLQWHESGKGKGFKFVNYQNFQKKYSEEFRTLISMGMNYANLGIWLHDYLEVDTEAEKFGLRETKPRYFSEWLTVLTTMGADPGEEEEVREPTKEELESGSEDEDSGEYEELEEESSAEEKVKTEATNKTTIQQSTNKPHPATLATLKEDKRQRLEKSAKEIELDFYKHSRRESATELCSTMISGPKMVRRTTIKSQPKTLESIPKVIQRDTSMEGSIIIDQSAILMNSLIEAMQMNTNLEGIIEPLKNTVRDPMEWFSHYDMITGARNWSSEIKARMLRTKLKGTSARVFKSLSPAEQNDYNTVKKRICEELRPRDSKLTASVDYFGAKQKIDESVGDFEHRLSKLRKRADLKIDNERMVEIFISGLLPQLRVSCAQFRHANYDEVVLAAKDHEQILPSPEEVEINAINSRFEAGKTEKYSKPVCFYCKAEGHTKTDCKKWKEIIQECRIVGKCFSCQKTGHLAAQCPEKKKLLSSYPVETGVTASLGNSSCQIETKTTIIDSLKKSNQIKGTVLAKIRGPEVDQSVQLVTGLAERTVHVGLGTSARVNLQIDAPAMQGNTNSLSWSRLGKGLRASRDNRWISAS